MPDYTSSENAGRLLIRHTLLTALLYLIIIPISPAAADEAAVKRFEVVITERSVQQDMKTLRVTQGDSIELVWKSDEAGSLHLHGYDIEFEVTPDENATVTFTAHATGRFPVTSHGFGGDHGHGHEAMLYLEVYPD